MQRLRVLIAVPAFALLLIPAAVTPGLTQETAPPSEEAEGPQVQVGLPVKPMKLQELLPGEKALKPLDLAATLGKRPLIICYVVMGESLGEETLLAVQDLALKQLAGKADVFGAMRLTRKITLPEAVERVSLLGIKLPLIVEDGFDLGSALGVTTSPSISLIDGGGILRIADAKSLRQKVERQGTTMSAAIMAAVTGGFVPTVEKLPRYYPANELVGEQFPDFILKKFGTQERMKLSDVVGAGKASGGGKDPGKITAVLFWHPNCPHCKKAMPGIVAGYNSYRKWVQMVSIVDLKNADETRNAQDAIKAHNMTFPVLEDEGRRITDLYKVVSTPTMFFVRPDGVVDSVYTSGDINYVPVISSRVRAILKIGGPPGTPQKAGR